MRALWLVRDNLEKHPGGDTVQILQTARALRELGVTVDLCSDTRPRLTGHDVVHLFHLDRLWENVAHCRRIRAAGVPAVLSTIYWPADEFDRGGRRGLQGNLARTFGSGAYRTLRVLQRAALAAMPRRSLRQLDHRLLSFDSAARYVLSTVAAVLPNSAIERDMLVEQFGIERPAVIVPNAVDTATFGPPSADTAPQRSGVLCVGRIEPRKNQLALIKALADTDIPLQLVGQSGRYSSAYCDECRAAAGDNVTFTEFRPPDELRQLYQRAAVHACVSWYETPGLASLEAALCGCQLVLTPGGSVREYFADDAHYCEPTEPKSIRTAVEVALQGPPNGELANRVAREFTWAAAAQKTRQAYELVTGHCGLQATLP